MIYCEIESKRVERLIFYTMPCNYFKQHKFHRVLAIALISCCLACMGSNNENSPEQRSPNIIIIMADDLGYNDLGCYSNDSLSTPNIDRLARGGIKFLDFHSNGTVCSPTRASLLTGKYPQKTGISGVVTAKNHRSVGMSLSEITIADYLGELGYATGISGKWHVGYDTAFSPINQGFDYFSGFVSGNIDYHTHYDQENHFDWWNGKTLMKQSGYATDLITEHAIDFINQNTNNPFFLYVAHGAPHYPYQGRKSKGFRGPLWNGDREMGDVPESKDIYREMIEVMDEGIGKLLSALDEKGILKNTFIFFLSDNGASSMGSNHPLRGYKSQVWEGGHRVPAIAYWEGRIKPSTNHSLLMGMDIFPTLQDMVKSEAPVKSEIDGTSFYPVLTGESLKKREPVFWKYKNRTAARKGMWKLVRNGDKYYLFNLEDDVGEENNLIDQLPEKFNEMKLLLEMWEKEMSNFPEIT